MSSKDPEYRKKKNLFMNTTGNWNKEQHLLKHHDLRCECCKEQFPSDILVFHHVDPNTKEMETGVRKWRGVYGPKKLILNEIKKCRVLCHNCHSLEHIAMRKGETLIDDPEAYSRYRNHRVTKPVCYYRVDDRDEEPEHWVQEELQLPTPTD